MLVDQGSWDTTKDTLGNQYGLNNYGLYKGRFDDRSAKLQTIVSPSFLDGREPSISRVKT